MHIATDSMAGMTWERLEREHTLTLPLTREGDPGQEVIFTDGFPTANKRGRFVPAKFIHADELPDREYPMVFSTGRQLEHWHTGSMTRRATVLDALEPIPVASFHPDDLAAIGAEPGDMIHVESKRGSIDVRARLDTGIQQGVIFMAFCYHEAAANLLTNPSLDPFGKIPGFKFCAIRIKKV